MDKEKLDRAILVLRTGSGRPIIDKRILEKLREEGFDEIITIGDGVIDIPFEIRDPEILKCGMEDESIRKKSWQKARRHEKKRFGK